MPGPDLLPLILVLPVAVLVATLVGGLLGRRIRDALDGQQRPKRPPRRPGATVAVPTAARPAATAQPDVTPDTIDPAVRAAAAAATAASVAAPADIRREPVPGERSAAAGTSVADAGINPIAPLGPLTAPDPRSTLVTDPDAARRLAGLPPPLATRVPSSVSPAMRDRGGLPLTAGALGPAREEHDAETHSGYQFERRAAAAPFTLSTRAPSAVAPATPVPAPGAPPAVAQSTPRRARRVGLGAAALSAVIAVALFAVASPWSQDRGGDVLAELGEPRPAVLPGPLVEATDRIAHGPWVTPGPVVPGATTKPGGGRDDTAGEPGDGTGGGTGRGANPGGVLDPGPTDPPGPTPDPDDTPRPTVRPTAEPTPRSTADPTPDPTPRPTADPTPDPTPEPTEEPRAPRAAFTVSVDGLRVELTNRTRGAVIWAWTFGDGESSTARNPTHAYADPGSYTITLTATSKAGGTDRVSQAVTVAP